VVPLPGKPVLASFLASHGVLLYLNPKTDQRVSPMVKKKKIEKAFLAF
jgi:hypothetical protein